MKHTPKPWIFTKLICNEYRIESQPDFKEICEVKYFWDYENESDITKQNANLISAAPDLLEACKEALGAFESNNAIDWNILKLAIDKAEGNSIDNNT